MLENHLLQTQEVAHQVEALNQDLLDLLLEEEDNNFFGWLDRASCEFVPQSTLQGAFVLYILFYQARNI